MTLTSVIGNSLVFSPGHSHAAPPTCTGNCSKLPNMSTHTKSTHVCVLCNTLLSRCNAHHARFRSEIEKLMSQFPVGSHRARAFWVVPVAFKVEILILFWALYLWGHKRMCVSLCKYVDFPEPRSHIMKFSNAST